LGQAQSEHREAYFSKLARPSYEDLGDPRWLSILRLLELTRGAVELDSEIIETGNYLEKELRRCFILRQRLLETLELLDESVHQEDLQELIQSNEERIIGGLEAVKSLHMITISREVHGEEHREWERIQHSLQRLQIEKNLFNRFATEVPSSEEQEEESLRRAHVEQVIRRQQEGKHL
jgi:hypothetical protein